MSLFEKLRGKAGRIDIKKRFNLLGRVGQGSMSKVWKADDYISGRRVALKILDKEKTDRFESRFAGLNKPSEGQVALGLIHPNIVRSWDIGVTLEGESFLVMEYIDGTGLSLLVDLQSDQMKRYRLRYLIQIGQAVSYMHQHDWIHRDLCPRNVLINEENQVKLIDFGLVVPNQPQFRRPGNRTGTANYMAPELIMRKETDQRLDVFSYAVSCFEMYTKRHPWHAAMTIDSVVQHINQPALEITALVPKIDNQIATTIMKGLEKDPNDRWQTVAEMVCEFRHAEARLVDVARHVAAQRKAARKKKHRANRASGDGETQSDASQS